MCSRFTSCLLMRTWRECRTWLGRRRMLRVLSSRFSFLATFIHIQRFVLAVQTHTAKLDRRSINRVIHRHDNSFLLLQYLTLEACASSLCYCRPICARHVATTQTAMSNMLLVMLLLLLLQCERRRGPKISRACVSTGNRLGEHRPRTIWQML